TMGPDLPGSVLTRFLARRTVRSGARWGLVFGAIAASSVIQFTTAYDTPASRREIATTVGGNGAFRALFGSGRSLETIPGWTAWRSLGLVVIVGSMWGLLAATRWQRGEEDAGRWELLVAGPTTRRAATRSAVLAMAAGLVALWATTAAVVVAVDRTTAEADFGLRASLFLAVALVAPAAVAMAIGAVAGQVVPTRRHSSGLGAAGLAGAYLIRMVADSGSALRWARWATPLGWVEHLHPLTGSSAWPLVPLALFVGGVGFTAVVLAGRRDVGAGLRAADDSAPPRTALLTGTLGLAARQERAVLLAWAGGVAGLSFLFGLIAASLARAPSSGLSEALARLGARGDGAAPYLGTFLFIVGAVLALAAAGQVADARREESHARLDAVLAQPVRRLAWLAGRLLVPAAALAGLAVVAGLSGWAGARSQGAAVGLGHMTGAALNAAVPAFAVIGAGVLALGVAPRRAVAAVYALIGWSFVVQLLVVAGPGSRLLLDLSLFHHVALMPAAPFRPGPAVALLAGAAVAAASGAVAFERRDLVGD
ncbi:MAG: hypothetical protein LC792_00340, partial [Actinobacteria bacterium]|nr:hypothetical protein [Actinomycetota bacterium]